MILDNAKIHRAKLIQPFSTVQKNAHIDVPALHKYKLNHNTYKYNRQR